MTPKQRIKLLEKATKQKQTPAILWQELQADGVVLRYSDGQRVTVKEPMRGVKIYDGISPDTWDEVEKVNK
jgi:hypothetical protein